MVERSIGDSRILLVRGDITDQQVDAVVNAANSSLSGGGGVDGAIHRKGGPSILEACRRIVAVQGGCPTGEAVITEAGQLPARFVIHTVGPVWSGGARGEDALLERCWTRSLELATESGVRTVAFPSISTGSFRFPVDRAAAIAVRAVDRFLTARSGVLDEVRLVLFSDVDYCAYARALEQLVS